MRATAAAERPVASARKPVGGFRFITVVQLCMVWWAYHQKLVRLYDLRVWFACQEVVSRRCRLASGQRPEYRIDEIHKLVGGVGGEYVRSAVNRLTAAGLIEVSLSGITFPVSPDAIPVEDLSGLWAMIDQIQNNKRRVPVPRRTLRFIAGGAKKAVIATILGHLFRCLYYRGGECVATGSCKASWIAGVFGVTTRSVKAARKHLASIGWLVRLTSEHWHRQRWGGKAVINLAWSRDVATSCLETAAMEDAGGGPVETESSPRQANSTAEFSPPDSDRELPSEYQNQKPAGRGPSGALKAKEGDGKPSMTNVKAADLGNTARLLALFEDAERRGLVNGSEHDRFQFVAAAEHASVIGSRNPCGLFAVLVRKGLWHFITQADEDAAQRRLKQHFHGSDERENPKPERQVRSPRIVLSEDARVVAAVRRVVQQNRVTGDPFYLLRQHRPDWTRERWAAAEDELERSRMAILQAKHERSVSE